MVGQTISHYKIQEKLGEGGMGVVYKAHDTKLNRTVALKFLPQNIALSETDRKRFIHEAQAASALDHPNICTIHEIDETPDGQLFIVMPAYEGTPLNKKIEQGPLPIDEAINIAMQIADGLQTAHEKGIVHRDIKSSNIFITQKKQVKILDFGLARGVGMTQMTKTGMTMGTVPYMSPEQARGEKVDHRTDIWSLGVILYEMISGRMPFRGDYSEAIVYQILTEDPEPVTSLRSNVPMELERIVKKILEKDRSTRYQTVSDLLADLRKLNKELESGEKVGESTKRVIPRKRQRYLYGSLGTFAVIVIIAVLYLIPGKTDVVDSIAVLPLKNLMGDPEQDYFVEGMHDALTAELSKISALKVISRTSAIRYRDTDKPMPQIARELGVKGLIEGSVLREGDQVRITVQLIHGPTDRHLWAESYRRGLRDILALQGEVAMEITRQVQVAVSPEEEFRLVHSRTVNPEAYEAFLRGRWYQRRMGPGDLEMAREHYVRALEIDPAFAPAYAGMAEYHTAMAFFGYITPSFGLTRAKTAALRALELDSALSETYSILASITFYFDWNWDEAERLYKRAFELNSNDPIARERYTQYLRSMRRFEEALAQIPYGKELDPLSPSMNYYAGRTLYDARRYTEAIEKYQRAIRMDPRYAQPLIRLGELLIIEGKYQQGLEYIQNGTALIQRPSWALATLGWAYGISGDEAAAHDVLSELEELSEVQHVFSFSRMLVHLGLGQMNEALEWLERAYRDREVWMVWLNSSPQLDSLRDDPRFQNLLLRMNFPEN